MVNTLEMLDLIIQTVEEDAMREVKAWRNCFFTKAGKVYYGEAIWPSEEEAKRRAEFHIQYAKKASEGRLSVMYTIVYLGLTLVCYTDGKLGSAIETHQLSHFIPLPVKS